MSPRLLVVTLVIVVSAAVTLYLNRDGAAGPQNSNRIGQPLFGDFAIAEVSQVELVNADRVATLRKDDQGVWILKEADFPVNSQALFIALEEYKTMKIADLLTADPQKHKLFGLTDTAEQPPAGGSIKIIHGSVVTTVLVGERRSDGTGVYARLADQNDVYLLKDSIAVNTDRDYWLNLKFINLEPADLAGFSWGEGANAIRVAHSDNIYRLAGFPDQTPDTGKIDQFQRMLNPFRFTDLASDDAAGAEEAVLSLDLAEGETKLRFVFSADPAPAEDTDQTDATERVVRVRLEAPGGESSDKLKHFVRYLDGKQFVYEPWRFDEIKSLFAQFAPQP